MIQFVKVSDKDRDYIEAQRVAEEAFPSHERLALAGNLPAHAKSLTVQIDEAVVAFEHERGGKFVSLMANDADNWQVESGVIRQVARGRGRVGIDFGGGFAGSSGRPDCATIMVPFSQSQLEIKIVIGGGSTLVIEHLSASNLEIQASGCCEVRSDVLRVHGNLSLTTSGIAKILAGQVTCQSFQAQGEPGGIVLNHLETNLPRSRGGMPAK